MRARIILQAMPTRENINLPDANLEPCHVGVVYAMALEAASLEARLNGMISLQAANFAGKQGGLKGRSVVVVHAGAGEAKAEAATAGVLRGHRPHGGLAAGWAGGLNAKMRRGDVLMPDAILGEDGRPLAI